MKFSFRRKTVEKDGIMVKGQKKYRLVGYDKLRKYRQRALDEIPNIDVSDLLHALDIPQKKVRKRKRASPISAWISRLSRNLREYFSRKKARKREKSTAMAAGLLTAAASVTFLSALLVLAPYLLRYNRPYTSVTIPDFTSLSYNEILSSTDERFDLVINLTENISAKAGEVITQSPKAGAERRIYGKDDKPTVILTISAPKESLTLPNLVGKAARDVSLELRNSGFKVKLIEEYSENLPSGTILATLPVSGETIDKKSEITLTVSRGKRIVYTIAPALMGLSESKAVSKIKARGLSIGEIKYSRSESHAGTVIYQSEPQGVSLPLGTSISLTVSTGIAHSDRTVPSLLGLTLEEAKEKLKGAGLVVGEIYYINDGEADGTEKVVKQSPNASTPISSSIVSVDLYMG